MKRVLIYVEKNISNQHTITWIMDFIKRLDARLISLYIIEHDNANDDIEDEAWKILYHIEDIAFEHEVKISLLLEKNDEKTSIEIINNVISTYDIYFMITTTYVEGVKIPQLVVGR